MVVRQPHLGESRRWLGSLILVLLVLSATPSRSEARAYLRNSDPRDLAVLSSAPPEVRLWYSDPVEPALSTGEIYDADGERIHTSTPRHGADRSTLTVALPSTLPQGGYVLYWTTVSAVDGQHNGGAIRFWIGNAPGVPIDVQSTGTGSSGYPATAILGRAVSLFGTLALAGGVLFQTLVLQPALRRIPSSATPTRQRVVFYVLLVGLLLTVVGGLIELVTMAGLPFNDGVSNAGLKELLSSHAARLIVWRVIAAACLALIALLWPVRVARHYRRAIIVFVAALALAPFAFSASAASLDTGAGVAVVTEWLLLTAQASIVGGVVTVATVAIVTRRLDPHETQQQMWDIVTQRSRAPLVVAIAVTAVAGAYGTSLHVGNSSMLTDSDWGKLTLTSASFSLLLAALVAGMVFYTRGRLLITASLVGMFLAMGMVGTSVSAWAQPTGSELVSVNASSRRQHWSYDRVHLTSIVTPSAGASAIELTLEAAFDDPQPTPPTLTILAVAPDGTRSSIETATTDGVKYTATLEQISVLQPLDLKYTLSRTNREGWIAYGSLDPAAVLSSASWDVPRFQGPAAVAGVAGLVSGIIFAAIAAVGRSTERRPLAAFSIVIMVAAGWVLFANPAFSTGGSDLLNPQPMTMSSVQAGELLYLQECAGCHGDDGTGDGPRAPTMNPGPIDLHAEHLDGHTDGDLYWSIRYGKDAMPGTDTRLPDSNVWHLVNYVRSLRHPDQILIDLCDWPASTEQ